MLDVYTYRITPPKNCIDFSFTLLDNLTEEAIAVFEHHKNVHIWFGFLDGWMLNPREEVLLRKVIRTFNCSLVTAFPLALSQSWKNEIGTIYTDGHHGAPDTDNNGSSVYDRCQAGYGQASTRTSTDRQDDQN